MNDPAPPIARVDQIPTPQGLEVNIGSLRLVLFRVEGEVIALDARCPHRGTSLAAGRIEEGILACPMHGWRFAAQTGTCLDRPDKPIRRYPITVLDGQIWLALTLDEAPTAPRTAPL